tara:strand:+ start:213 stop:521 length:309 start_codon:yes stop_codon:yes gene_type:complete
MKKFSVTLLILSLILFTAFIKNSTKRIDDEVYIISENIRDLKKDYENIRLEHEYLSSAEKLFKFKEIYFDGELLKKDVSEIKKINKKLDKLEVEQLKLINEQ